MVFLYLEGILFKALVALGYAAAFRDCPCAVYQGVIIRSGMAEPVCYNCDRLDGTILMR